MPISDRFEMLLVAEDDEPKTMLRRDDVRDRKILSPARAPSALELLSSFSWR
jgi:hypothetical protein